MEDERDSLEIIEGDDKKMEDERDSLEIIEGNNLNY